MLFASTIISHSAVVPSSKVAVMVAVPSDMAVTTPLPLTAATVGASLVQVTFCPAGLEVAVKVMVSSLYTVTPT